LIWTRYGNQKHKEEKFDNDDAWRALELAGKTMHDYNFKRDRYVLGYVNGEEVEITPHNALDIIFSYKPNIVLVYLKTSDFGKGTLTDLILAYL
jgi:hypothetical protein